MTEVKQQIPPELQDSKAFQKLEKSIGFEPTRDFYQRSNAELKETLSACEVQIVEARQDMEANPEYQKAKAILKDFNSAFKDATKLLHLKIQSGAEILHYRDQLKEQV